MNLTVQRARTGMSAAAVGTIIVGAVLCSVLGFAAPAQAHNYVVASTPAENEVLTELPELFSVTTNSSLLELPGNEAAFAIQVSDEAGLYFGDGCVTIDGASIHSTAALGKPGDYTMVWQVISADGHPVSGEIAFEWAPTDSTQQSVGVATPPVCGVDVTGSEEQQPAPGDGAEGDGAERDGAEGGAPRDSVDEAAVSADASDVVWIAGALGAVAIAVIATVVVLRRTNDDQPEKSELVE